MVYAYAQNLGILLLNPAVVSPEGGRLVGSPGGEIKDMERQNNMLVAFVLAQAYLLVGG